MTSIELVRSEPGRWQPDDTACLAHLQGRLP